MSGHNSSHLKPKKLIEYTIEIHPLHKKRQGTRLQDLVRNKIFLS